ncbi:MAG: DNA translocase FtsK [Candidatus Omnitrophota bacterium]
MKKVYRDEIQGLIIFSLGLILLVSLISFVPQDLPWYTSQPNVPAQNLVRVVGAYLAGGSLFIFGYGSYVLAVFLLFWSWNKFSGRDIEFTFPKFLSSLVLFCSVSTLLSMIGPQADALRFERSGLVGFLSADFLIRYLGWIGAFIILATLCSLTLVLTGEFLVSFFLLKMGEVFKDLAVSLQEHMAQWRETLVRRRSSAAKSRRVPVSRRKAAAAHDEEEEEEDEEYEDDEYEDEEYEEEDEEEEQEPVKPNIRIANVDETPRTKPVEPKVIGEYHMPRLDLLDDAPEFNPGKVQNDLQSGAQTLESTMKSFNVNVRVADIERGPVITRYELEPAPGVKVHKITNLSDDIALAMKVAAVRIVAPIPGKNRVGIEVPNSAKAAVFLKELLATDRFQQAKSKLTLALGKDISGSPLIADLAEMPHLLIAGTTGSGKTVCVNTIIMSMLYNASPDELKFLMVDPKMVELTPYNDIPHMLCPAVTDAKKVSSALNWVVSEMEHRYQLLSKERVRNIKSYRAKGLEMPYIVVIVDELADLMQVSAKTIESAITRLAQLSRAVGIHLILATQRPSVDVITGVIKANFPARVSFKVASKTDSRTVLDMNGAETLLGKGDLLFIQPGDAKPTRGQCSFVSDQEVFRVIDFIKQQQSPDYDETILQKKGGTAGGADQSDELYDDAVKLVIETNQASVSILQRRMRLGYTRAARLIDMMEQNGVVGPYVGSKPRDILVDREQWLLENMEEQSE